MTGSRPIFAVGWKSAGWREVGSASIKAERASEIRTSLLALVKATYRRFY